MRIKTFEKWWKKVWNVWSLTMIFSNNWNPAESKCLKRVLKQFGWSRVTRVRCNFLKHQGWVTQSGVICPSLYTTFGRKRVWYLLSASTPHEPLKGCVSTLAQICPLGMGRFTGIPWPVLWKWISGGKYNLPLNSAQWAGPLGISCYSRLANT